MVGLSAVDSCSGNVSCFYVDQPMVGPGRILAALFGLLSVAIFAGAYFSIGLLAPDFDIAGDYISELGAQGRPYAGYWNLIGFGIVGCALALFGWFFGLCRDDRILGGCLAVAGIGFAFAAIPADFSEAHSPLSKAHYAAICFSLAGWCCGLARLACGRSTNDFAQTTANYSVALALLPMVCIGGGISAEPIAHRLVLVVAFTWVTLNSIQLLRQSSLAKATGQ